MFNHVPAGLSNGYDILTKQCWTLYQNVMHTFLGRRDGLMVSTLRLSSGRGRYIVFLFTPAVPLTIRPRSTVNSL